MSERHETSVVNEYHAAITWTARCSCGWEEQHGLSYVADRAAEMHRNEHVLETTEVEIKRIAEQDARNGRRYV